MQSYRKNDPYTGEVIDIGDVPPPTFWNTGFGKFLRWLLYIPVGSILIGLIEFLTIFFFLWLFKGDLRMFIIIGIIFGGLFTLLPMIVMAYYGSLVLANKMICPGPKVGTIIFGTLYVLGAVPQLISVCASGSGAGMIVPCVIIKLIFGITAIVAFIQIYSEET